jgi:hypothetical protein
VDSREDGQARHATRQAVVAEGAHSAVYNQRGVIAESYYDLQALGLLEAARTEYPLPKASNESTLRAVFQAAEIGLLNLADIMTRAAADVERDALGTAVVKLFWARGFHRVMTRLGMIPQQLGLMNGFEGEGGLLRIHDSPAFADYLGALKRFDRSVLSCGDAGKLTVEDIIADASLDSAQFNLLHLARLCSHESTVWERTLAEVAVPAPVPSYATFVVARGMRDAVYDRVLTGDTYFTQFRGLHQIPETLGEELNDRLEQAIRDVRGRQLQHAIEQLDCVEALSEAILASLPAITDNLSTSDYHQIRENLGLTSGSHSVCLRFHMFTHLYEQLWDELAGLVAATAGGADAVEDIRMTERRRGADSDAWLIHALCNYCLRLRTFIMHWREEHLNLPRNNLGGDYTKSLTGSPDAVQAVKQMRESARTKDAMQQLARARQLAVAGEAEPGELTGYVDSRESLDTFVLSTTGRITQKRFHDVQERLGFFADRCPFRPPAKRRA